MNLVPRESLFGLDRFFGDFWNGLPAGNPEGVFSPRVDIRETDDKYFVSAELPGIDKENVDVELDNGMLTISATRSDEHEEKQEGKVIRRERRYGQFARSFYVGTGVHEKDIVANFRKGVLELEIPKKGEAAPERRRIAIS